MKQDLSVPLAALGQLPVLLAVAEHRSFTRAAHALGVSTSAVSQTIARLEAAVATPLVVRTTRSVNLTEAGERLVAEARPAIATASAALAATRARTGEPTGLLRLNVPQLAYKLLEDLVPRYLRAHPQMQVDITVDNRSVDIVAGGFDAGIRLREGLDRDMISLRVTGPLRFLVVASPRYLAARGTPRHPRDLVDHACLAWRSLTTGIVYPWQFERAGKALEVAVRGPVISNDTDVLRDAALADLGLSFLPEADARAAIAAGRLVSVLEPWLPAEDGLHLYYPRAARTVPKLAAFVECVRTSPDRRAR